MIAIPNTDKPKGCIDCPVNDMVCELWTKVANIKAHKHKDCPLIDIVPCKECKWFIEQGEGNVGKCKYRTRPMLYCLPTDFCSYGEREEK